MTYREAAPLPWREGGPVPNAARLFPRPHPSAYTALGLGVAAVLGLGPLAGVPAIWLGRVVEREVAAAPALYGGGGLGRWAAYLGLGGTAWVGLLAVALSSSASKESGVALAIAGFLVAGVALVLGSKGGGASWRVRLHERRANVAGSGWGVALAALAGLWNGHENDLAKAKALVAECGQYRLSVESDLAGGRLDAAKRSLLFPPRGCPADDERAFNAALALLKDREDEARRVAEENAAERRRKAAAAKRIEDLGRTAELLASSEAKAARAAWMAADADLASANTLLEGYRGEAASADWSLHFRKAASLGKRVTAPAEALRKAQAARESRETAARTAREEREAAASAAREAAATRRERASMRALLCADGTESPSCTCGGPRRGCCSHHGGVVGCAPVDD